MSDLFAVQIRQESLLLDTDSIMKSLTSKASTYEINSFFFFFNYLKGKIFYIKLNNNFYILIALK